MNLSISETLDTMHHGIQLLLQDEPTASKDAFINVLSQLRRYVKSSAKRQGPNVNTNDAGDDAEGSIGSGSEAHNRNHHGHSRCSSNHNDNDNLHHCCCQSLSCAPNDDGDGKTSTIDDSSCTQLLGPYFQNVRLDQSVWDTNNDNENSDTNTVDDMCCNSIHGSDTESGWFFVNKATWFALSPSMSPTAHEWGPHTLHIFLATVLANTALAFYHMGCQQRNGNEEAHWRRAASLYTKSLSCIEEDMDDASLAIKSIALNNLAYINHMLGDEDAARVNFSEVHWLLNKGSVSMRYMMDPEDLEGMSINILVSKICRPTAARAA